MIKVLKELQSSTPLHRDHTKLHASDMGAIISEELCNVVRFGKPAKQIIQTICDARHRNILPAENSKNTLLTDIGWEQEIVIKDVAKKICGIDVVDADAVNVEGIVLGHPDGITEYEGEKVIFEAKRVVHLPAVSASKLPEEHWFAERVGDNIVVHNPDDFFDKFTLVSANFIPLRYLVQVALYAYGHNVNKVIFGVQWLVDHSRGEHRHFFLLIDINKAFVDEVMKYVYKYERQIKDDVACNVGIEAQQIYETGHFINPQNTRYVESLTFQERGLLLDYAAKKEQAGAASSYEKKARENVMQMLEEKNIGALKDKSGKSIFSFHINAKGKGVHTFQSDYKIDNVMDLPYEED